MSRRTNEADLLALIIDMREKLMDLRNDRDAAECALNDALEEFRERRKKFDGLLETWRALHADKSPEDLWPPGFEDIDKFADNEAWRAGSDLDAADWQLRLSVEPLHVDELIRGVRKRTGRRIDKNSLVSSVMRHVKADHYFLQAGPNTFGIKALHGPGGLVERQKAHQERRARAERATAKRGTKRKAKRKP